VLVIGDAAAVSGQLQSHQNTKAALLGVIVVNLLLGLL
jgi:hypothetical protein